MIFFYLSKIKLGVIWTFTNNIMWTKMSNHKCDNRNR